MSAPQARLDREHPWPALLAFREDDQGFFGGRDEEIEALYRRIAAGRLTLLFGLSGLGKTSLLRAGLFPRLRRERYFPVYVRLSYGRELPSPVEQIKAEIAAQAKASGVEAPEARAGETLWEYFHRADADFWDERNNPCTPVLVFDQFEELFTKSREVPAAANEVVEELANLAEGASPELLRKATAGDRALLRQVWDGRYRLLISIRSDYLAQLQGISDRMRAIFANRFELRRMNGAAALRSTLKAGAHLMDEPVARRVVRFVAGAAETADLVPAVEELEVEPALLSLVCSELNAARLQRGEAKITASMLSGSKDEILSRFYESSFADLAPELRELVEDKLVTRDGRSRNFISEQTAQETPGVTEDDLGKLVHRRLLRFEESGSSRRLELTHDLLAGVAAASRSTREQRRQLEDAERARADAEEREASARKKLRRSRAAILLFVVLLAVAVAGPFVAARWTAIGAKKIEADSAFRLAVQKLSSDEPAEGLAYLARVIRLDRGNSAARTLLYEQLVTRSWPVPIRDFGPDRRIDEAVFSKDGARVAFRLGKTVEMWDVAEGKRLGMVDADGDISFAGDGRTILFREITEASGDETVLWNPLRRLRLTAHEIGRRAAAVAGPESADAWRESPPEIQDLSADGEELLIRNGYYGALAVVPLRRERPLEQLLPATGGSDAQFFSDPRLVLVNNGIQPDVIDRQAPPRVRLRTIPGVTIPFVDISSDSRRVLLSQVEGEIETWDVESWASTGRPFDNQSPPQSAAFDATGGTVLTTGEDGGIRLWNVETGTQSFDPLWIPHVQVAGFSADGARIFAASDRVARWWGAHDGDRLGEPVVRSKMLTAHLDSRGNIVTVSTKARVWELATLALPPPATRVDFDRLSADRKTTLSGRAAYDTGSGELLWTAPEDLGDIFEVDPQFSRAIVLRRHGEALSMVDIKSGKLLWTLPRDAHNETFSDDGTVVFLLVKGESGEEHAVVLSAATGVPLAPPVDSGEWRGGAMSNDGSVLALASEEGALRVWDFRRRRVMKVAKDYSVHFALSDDGRQLATVSSRGLWVWDIATGRPRSPKWNEQKELLVPKFSPDGSRLAVTSESGVVLCDEQTLDCGDEMLAHADVREVEFSADGSRIMTVTNEDFRVWDAGTRQPLSLSLPRTHTIPVGLSPDGAFVVGYGNDGLYRLPLPSIDDADADRLATIGEALAGVRIDRLGVSEPVDGIKALVDLEEQCQGVQSHACTFVHWLRTPAAKRTISPLSNVSVADYLERMEHDWWWAKARFPDHPGLGTKPPE